jgi:hypothetical protein
MLGDAVMRRLAAVAVTAALLGGCGSGSRTTVEGKGNRSPDYDQAAAVVTEYVEAIRAGDVDAAVALRCRAARPAAELMDEFAGELRRLERGIGSIDGVETRQVISALEPMETLPGKVHVGYRIVVEGNVTGEMVAVTVVEDGKRRLCGHATAVSQDWAEALESRFTPQPATSADLVDLMPDAGPHGMVQYDDHEVPVEQLSEPRPGLIASWIRTWRRDSGSGPRASVEAHRFDTEEHAIDAARSLVGQHRADGVAMFSVMGVPGAVGFRVMGWSWLYVQPPNLGPTLDAVTVVYGTTVVVIKVSDETRGEGVASGLARSVSVVATDN